MVTSNCGIELSYYTQTNQLYQGNTYNIPNSPYSIEIISQYCDAIDIGDNYSVVRVSKNGTIIGESIYYVNPVRGNQYLYDNNNLCIELKLFDCSDANPSNYYTTYDVWYNIPIPPPIPTHYLEFKMSFVPMELVDYIDTYIIDISNTLMTHLPTLPFPWEYVKTTYNRDTNSFIMWLYTPNALGLIEDIISIGQWAIAYVSMIVGTLLVILAIILALYGLPHIALIILAISAGFIITGYTLYEIKTSTAKLTEKLNNANVTIQADNNENKGRGDIENEWNKSIKDKTSCKTRLEGHRNIHIAKIDGLINNYSKYTNLVTNLKTEKNTFTTQINNIINELDLQPYSEATCNSYYISIDNLINNSNITISSLINSYVNPDETYEPTCTGWLTKVDCETAKCYWYNNKCNSEPECLIPLPGGCLITKDTAVTLTIVGGILLGGYVLLKTTSPKK